MSALVYADYAATRPLRPEVREALAEIWADDEMGIPLAMLAQFSTPQDGEQKRYSPMLKKTCSTLRPC